MINQIIFVVKFLFLAANPASSFCSHVGDVCPSATINQKTNPLPIFKHLVIFDQRIIFPRLFFIFIFLLKYKHELVTQVYMAMWYFYWSSSALSSSSSSSCPVYPFKYPNILAATKPNQTIQSFIILCHHNMHR